MAVLIEWDNPNDPTEVDGFRIYRSTSPFDATTLPAVLTDVSPNISEYEDSTAGGGTLYYAVSAYNSEDEEFAFSNITGLPAPVAATAPPVTATRLMVAPAIGLGSFYETASTTRGDNASVAKLLTACVLIDEKEGVLSSETLTIESGDLVGDSNTGLQAGDILTLEQALYTMLLPSDNEAAEAIARHVGDQLSGTGTGREKYLDAMSALLTGQGASGFTIANPGGGPGGTNLLSPEECIEIGRLVLSRTIIHTVTNTAVYTYNIQGPQARSTTVEVTHLLQDRGDFKFGKTGTTATGSANLLTCLSMPNGEDVIFFVGDCDSNIERYYDTTALIFDMTGVSFASRYSTTVADPATGTVSLKLSFEIDQNDESNFTHTGTLVGTAAVSSTASVAGNQLLDPGASGRLTFPDSDEFSFGAGDFTVEFFLRGDGGSIEASETHFIGKYNEGAFDREWVVILLNSQIRAYFSLNGATRTWCGQGLSPSFFNGAPRHIAFQREGDLFTVFLNGIRGIVSASTQTWILHNGPAEVTIGAAFGGGNQFTGAIDNVRITKGEALFPLADTPQAAAIYALPYA